jgi:hypothetical protein
VRSYFFAAHHYRGLPQFVEDLGEKHDFDDFAWVPKRQMNEYLTEEYFKVFIHGLLTR